MQKGKRPPTAFRGESDGGGIRIGSNGKLAQKKHWWGTFSRRGEAVTQNFQKKMHVNEQKPSSSRGKVGPICAFEEIQRPGVERCLERGGPRLAP